METIQDTSDVLCKEIADKILEINGNPPSALFLAGGGSKLTGLKDGLTAALQMDAKRVAIAGNNFRTTAFSDEYDLNNPEYATPLGIVVSSGLNLINASFRVMLNGRPANLFRSGSFTALNLLMMNGYSFLDIMGRSGFNLVVTVNGKRKVFYGTTVEPASLFINKKEGKLSEIIQAGDEIDFTPAVSGESASACLGDIEGAADCLDLTLNGERADLETPLKNGDVIVLRMPGEEAEPEAEEEPEELSEISEEEPVSESDTDPGTEEVSEPKETPASEGTAELEEAPGAGEALKPEEVSEPARVSEPVKRPEPKVHFHLNGQPISLPKKEDGSAYFLMDMIQYSGIDLKQAKGRITLTVNGTPGVFLQQLREGDNIRIEEEEA